MSFPARLLGFLVLLPWAASIGAQGPADPFGAGLRWALPSAPGTPWIPRDVTFVGRGEFVWSAPAVANPRVQLTSAAGLTSPAPVLLEDDAYAGAIGPVRVAAGDEVRELYSLVQVPGTAAGTRRTRVARYDAEAASGLGTFAPVWTHDLGFTVIGPAELVVAADGSAVAVAVLDGARGELRLRWLQPADGAIRDEQVLPATGLRALRASADGLRLLVAAGLSVVLCERDLAAPVLTRTLPQSTEAIALSADGATLAYGAGSQAVLEVEGGSGFAPRLQVQGAAGELATRLALSADGTTLAAAWWDSVRGNAVRCELRDPTGAQLFELTQTGAAGSVQNYPVALHVSGDGARVALGTWGLDDGGPEVLLLDRAGTALLAEDLGGSAYALALDPSGTRVAVASKDTHANYFSTTGKLRLYDTGERDLQWLGPARPGGALDLAYRTGGPATVVFGFGMPGTLARTFLVLGGELWLDPQVPIAVWVRSTPAAGRVDLRLPLAGGAGLVGLTLAAQALEVGPQGAGFSRTWLSLEVF